MNNTADKPITNNKFNPPSQDHIIKINPSADVVLALDNNGDELARLAFEVSGKTVFFKTPTVAKYPGFIKKLAELFTILSRFMPNVELPENLTDAFKNPQIETIWKDLGGLAISRHTKVKEIVLELFFDYMDAGITGLTIQPKRREKPEKYEKRLRKHIKEWFIIHSRIDDLQRILAAILCVDELVKKNSTFLLEKKFHLQNSKEQNSELTLVKSQESQSRKSTQKVYSGFKSL